MTNIDLKISKDCKVQENISKAVSEEPIVMKINEEAQTTMASKKEKIAHSATNSIATCDRIILDDDALKVLNIARMAVMFDC